jgi:hypothetical protein
MDQATPTDTTAPPTGTDAGTSAEVSPTDVTTTA